MNWSKPPKKKNCGLEAVSNANRYTSSRANEDLHSVRATARGSSPLHQIARQGRQGEQESYETTVASTTSVYIPEEYIGRGGGSDQQSGQRT